MKATIRQPQPFERVSIVLSPLFLRNKPIINAIASIPIINSIDLNYE